MCSDIRVISCYGQEFATPTLRGTDRLAGVCKTQSPPKPFHKIIGQYAADQKPLTDCGLLRKGVDLHDGIIEQPERRNDVGTERRTASRVSKTSIRQSEE